MATNPNIVLIVGPPSTGKSSSLMQLKQQESMAYLNTDLKPLPFADRFKVNAEIEDARDILSFVDQVEAEPTVTGAVLDTITFLMSMYERQYVKTAADTQKAWGDYQTFYQELIHKLKAGKKDYAVFAHEDKRLNERTGLYEVAVPVKGATAKIGVEADFTTILSTKQLPISKVEPYENDLLTITDDEREDGFKYVFCTRVTEDHVGEKMRSALKLWSRKELYIDNNIQNVFDRLHDYYVLGKTA